MTTFGTILLTIISTLGVAFTCLDLLKKDNNKQA